MKTESIAWADFPWQSPASAPQTSKRGVLHLPFLATTVTILLLQDFAHAHAATEAVTAMASDGGGWEKAKVSILHILDYVSYGVIVFSGGSWMFGHRNKALDLLLSCGIGTVIIRHADDIENFFKSI